MSMRWGRGGWEAARSNERLVTVIVYTYICLSSSSVSTCERGVNTGVNRDFRNRRVASSAVSCSACTCHRIGGWLIREDRDLQCHGQGRSGGGRENGHFAARRENGQFARDYWSEFWREERTATLREFMKASFGAKRSRPLRASSLKRVLARRENVYFARVYWSEFGAKRERLLRASLWERVSARGVSSRRARVRGGWCRTARSSEADRACRRTGG